MTDVVWDVTSWMLTGLVCWLAGLYCMKRTSTPYYDDICRRYFPSALSYAVLFFVFQMFLAIGAYRVWTISLNWTLNSTALALYCATQASTVFAQFVTFYFFTYYSVIFGGLLLFVTCALSIATAVFFHWAPDDWAMVFAIAYAVFTFVMAILTISFAYYGNSHVCGNGSCPVYMANAWPVPPKRARCPTDYAVVGGGGGGKRSVAVVEDGSGAPVAGGGSSIDGGDLGMEALLGRELSTQGFAQSFSQPPRRDAGGKTR